MKHLSSGRIALSFLAPIVIGVFAAGCNQSSTSSGSQPAPATSSNSQAAPAIPQPASTGSVALSWVAPLTNSDGTTLTNLAGYYIHYGNTTAAMNNVIHVPTAGLTIYVIDNLPKGKYYFSISSYSAAGVESPPSPVISTTLS
jgi:hypothetical protein